MYESKLQMKNVFKLQNPKIDLKVKNIIFHYKFEKKLRILILSSFYSPLLHTF
jgi:hypothetical protein